MLARFKEGHWPIFFMSILASLVNLVLPIVLVRMLEPAQIGLYKIFFLYVQVVTFLSMSGGPLYSVYYWIGKKELEGRDYLKQSWLLSLILSLLVVIIGFIFVTPLANKIELSEAQMRWLLIAAAIATPAAYYGEYLISKGQRVGGSLLNSGFEVMKGLLIVVIAFLTRDINSILIAYTLLFLVKLILNIILGIRSKIFDLRLNPARMKEVFAYCAPISLAGTLGFLVEKVDMILLSSLIAPSEFAFYSLGCLVVPPLLLLEMSVQKVLIPELSRSYHQQTPAIGLEIFKKAQREIALLMIPAVFGLFIFAAPIMEFLFTKQYLSSSIYLKVFAIGYLAHIFPHDSVPRASGKTGWLLKIYLIFTPITMVVVYLAAINFGALGALCATIIFKFLPKIPSLIYSARIMNWKFSEMFAYKSLARFTSVCSVLTIGCYSSKTYFINDLNWFFVCAPIFAATYLGTFYYLKKVEAS